MRAFFKTVAIVTVFSICEKTLGFLYRIFLSRSIGSEGIGIYQVALSVFGLLCTICCSGTPITVSRLMTKYKAENNLLDEQRVISSGIFSSFAFAVAICLIFFFFKDTFSFLFADQRSYNVFLIILPGLIFTSVYSVLRGVFWGNKDFLPYSIIELLEELCMIVVGIITISFSHSITKGTYGAGIAVLISFAFSFSLSIAFFFFRRNKIKNPFCQLKPLLSSSFPITCMRTVSSFAVSLISIILPLRLTASGISKQQALASFGSAVGQALPILSIPTTLIGSFTLVLIPEISENYYKCCNKKLKYDTEKAIKTTLFCALLFIPTFSVLGDKIGVLLFNSPECGEYLRYSSFLTLFICLSTITTSILNSVGKEKNTLLYYIISGVLMLASIWFLPKYFGVYSLLIGFGFVYILSTLLNLRLINKIYPEKPKYIYFAVKAIMLTLPCIIFGSLLNNILTNYLGRILTLFVVAFIMIVSQIILFVCFNLIDAKNYLKGIKLFKRTKCVKG